MATVQLVVETKYSRRMIQLNNMLHDKVVHKQINQIIADKITPYVPKKSGKLQRSIYVGYDVISWGRGLPYANYQYEGIVWGPNLIGIEGNGVTGWRSRAPKHPTGRKLGQAGAGTFRPVWVIDSNGYRKANEQDPDVSWTFGYTTPGTMSQWTKVYEWKLKSDTNKEITRYLRQECKSRGLTI